MAGKGRCTAAIRRKRGRRRPSKGKPLSPRQQAAAKEFLCQEFAFAALDVLQGDSASSALEKLKARLQRHVKARGKSKGELAFGKGAGSGNA
jgi:hypothetical protein